MAQAIPATINPIGVSDILFMPMFRMLQTRLLRAAVALLTWYVTTYTGPIFHFTEVKNYVVLSTTLTPSAPAPGRIPWAASAAWRSVCSSDTGTTWAGAVGMGQNPFYSQQNRWQMDQHIPKTGTIGIDPSPCWKCLRPIRTGLLNCLQCGTGSSFDWVFLTLKIIH